MRAPRRAAAPHARSPFPATVEYMYVAMMSHLPALARNTYSQARARGHVRPKGVRVTAQQQACPNLLDPRILDVRLVLPLDCAILSLPRDGAAAQV